MKVLFTTNPLLGHFLPMVPLIRAVRTAGHEVRVATGRDLAPAVRRHGFPVWVVGPTMAQAWAELAASADPAASEFERQRHAACVLFTEPGVARARQLMPMAAGWRPDVVVHEQLETGGWEAAAVSGAVDVVHGLGTHIPHLTELAAHVCAMAARQLGTPDRTEALFAAPYLDPCPPSLQPPGEALFSQVLPLRPEIGAVYPGERLPEAMRHLPYEQTVYLTLGTAFNAPAAWRVVLEAVRDLPVNVIATTGADLDPESLGAQPPHVALPMAADQFANAEQLVRTGAGLAVLPGDRTPETIRAAITRVLDDLGFAQAAYALQTEIAAMPSAEQRAAELTALAGCVAA